MATGEFASRKPKSNRGTRGKNAEKAVWEVLESLKAKLPHFDAARQYDARTAGGKFPAQPGDYAWWLNTLGKHSSGLIEVKEVGHDFRLPKKNFPVDEIARMRRRQWAGQRCWVLVFHTTTARWRSVPLDFFVARLSQPSWDLSEFAPAEEVAPLILQEAIAL